MGRLPAPAAARGGRRGEGRGTVAEHKCDRCDEPITGRAIPVEMETPEGKVYAWRVCRPCAKAIRAVVSEFAVQDRQEPEGGGER